MKMFTTVRYFIKTSLVFLVVGILTGLHMSFAKYISQTGYTQELISAHTHLILVGSVMIMGVALWFFPLPEKNDKKYSPDLILVTYWMMTLATASRFVSQVLGSYSFIPLGKHSDCSFFNISSYCDDSIFLFNVGKN